MSEALRQKAERYSALKYTFALVDSFFLLCMLFLSLSLGVSKALESKVAAQTGNSFLVLPLYLLAGFLLYYSFSLPLHFYQSYTLEHRFSLTRQKISDWYTDQIKGFLLSYAFLLICVEAFYYILRRSPGHWWIVISVFWIFFSLILAKLVPLVIIPLFFKYTKLSDEGLRQRIKELAQKMQVALLDVFEIDFSKKTLKANAACVGWGATRRVILADTLQNNFTLDEIEVIVAHEFAHFRLKHLFKLILMSACVTIASFLLIFKTHGFFLHLFGFSSLSEFAALPIVCIYFLLIDILVTPLQNIFSRALERNADAMAIHSTGFKGAFICAMEKLASLNLADRKPHPVIKFFFFSHPPIDERIALAKSL